MDTILSLLPLMLLTAKVNAQGKQNIYASGCNGQTLRLKCDPGHRIAIKRLFYGVKLDVGCVGARRHARDCCSATHTDCLVNREEAYLDVNTHCSGYNRCKIEVKNVSTDGGCKKKITDYMTIIYDCIPDADIANFCSDDEKRGKVLYIANEEYPSSIRGHKPKCSCLATTENERGISLHSVDILLAKAEYGARSCPETIKIEDSFLFQKKITCGHRGLYGFRSVYDRTTKNVTISMESQEGRSGTAYVWLQVKARTSEDYVRVYCGESFRSLVSKSYKDSESRDRTKADGTLEKPSTVTSHRPKNESASAIFPLTPDMAAIVGGIVAASFVIFAILIISIAVHCRRQRRAKEPVKRVEMYPAMSPTPSLDVASYCRYDYDDDHYCSISRSPLKVSSQYDYTPNKNVVLGSPEYSTPIEETEELPPPPPPHMEETSVGDSQKEPLMNVPPRDYLTLREEVDSAARNHTLPPPNYYAVINKKGNKSPPPKTRSKSVTFSQPVAMVTPLPSGSEESMMEQESCVDKPELPPPMLDSPTKPETIQIPRFEGGKPIDSPARPLSTFRSPEEEVQVKTKFDLPPPPEDFDFDSDTQAQYDNIPYYTGKEKSFWLPPNTAVVNSLPNGKIRNIYETGV